MALDHYVSQVHLRKFYSPALPGRLYAIRKSDLKTFESDSRGVCGIHEGSTNAYLREDRAIEEFLETIEPGYNDALDKLTAGEIDRESIYTIAGFIAYVIACSPTGMRIKSGPLKSIVESGASILERRGVIPPGPAGLSLTDLLRDGDVEVVIDRKYPQAIGIQTILRSTASFGNMQWEILRNSVAESPFFTSDFPAAIESTSGSAILNRIVPLAPTLALRIRPDVTIDKNKVDLSFRDFNYRRRDVGADEITGLNRLIVRCAEETVFYRDAHPWVQPFVEKNRRYRIEAETQRTMENGGVMMVTRLRIAAKPTQTDQQK